MSNQLVKYGEHAAAPPGASCEVCGAPYQFTDHCHEHGWVRARLCGGCNTRMALVDRLITPRTNFLDRLLAVAGRCPDCPPVSIEDLGPTASMRSLYTAPRPMVDRTVRMNDDLYSRITDSAGEDQRSVNGEIVWLLRQGLETREGLTTFRQDFQRRPDDQVANFMLHELERLFGEHGIWKKMLVWDHQRAAVQEVQRLFAFVGLESLDAPEVDANSTGPAQPGKSPDVGGSNRPGRSAKRQRRSERWPGHASTTTRRSSRHGPARTRTRGIAMKTPAPTSATSRRTDR